MGTTTRGSVTTLPLLLLAMSCMFTTSVVGRPGDGMYRDVLESAEPTPPFLHLCQTIKYRRTLSDETYEFKPRSIMEVMCTTNSNEPSSTNRCVGGLFRCQQQRTTHYVLKRRVDNPTGCWIPDTVTVSSGCECMWPTEELHVSAHREDQLD